MRTHKEIVIEQAVLRYYLQPFIVESHGYSDVDIPECINGLVKVKKDISANIIGTYGKEKDDLKLFEKLTVWSDLDGDMVKRHNNEYRGLLKKSDIPRKYYDIISFFADIDRMESLFVGFNAPFITKEYPMIPPSVITRAIPGKCEWLVIECIEYCHKEKLLQPNSITPTIKLRKIFGGYIPWNTTKAMKLRLAREYKK